MGGKTGVIVKTVEEKVAEFLSQTPKAIAVLFFSFLSGQLWVFILFAYVRKSTKGNKPIQSLPGKTALGLAWFTFIMVPLYLLKFRNVHFDYEKILDISVQTLVFGIFFQIIIFAIFAKNGK